MQAKIPPLAHDEMGCLRQVAAFVEANQAAMLAATSWIATPEPLTTFRSTDTNTVVDLTVPAGIEIDTAQLANGVTERPQVGTCRLSIHPVQKTFYIKLGRRLGADDTAFSTIILHAYPESLDYWTGDFNKDSTTLLVKDRPVFQFLKSAWERHSHLLHPVKPFDPFNL